MDDEYFQYDRRTNQKDSFVIPMHNVQKRTSQTRTKHKVIKSMLSNDSVQINEDSAASSTVE